jgi:Sigma-70, region 4
MTAFEHLPPDQKAALSLLLRRGESYAQLASVLKISEQAVHDRAHAALAMLAPAQARGLPAERREQIGEFLLGQQSDDGDRLATFDYLSGDSDARAWAHAVRAQLAPLGDGVLPELPGEQPAAQASAPSTSAASSASVAPAAKATTGSAHPAARASLPVSRTAGAVLLAVLVAGVVAAALLIPSGGGSSKHSRTGPASRGTGTTAAGTPTQDNRITLRADDSKSKALGVALVLSEGSRYAFYLAAQHLPPSHGFFYAVWLYNSPTSHEPLGKSPAVSSNGTLQGGAFLPNDAGNYHQMLLTRETSEHPSKPGPVVLRGTFALHG